MLWELTTISLVNSEDSDCLYAVMTLFAARSADGDRVTTLFFKVVVRDLTMQQQERRANRPNDQWCAVVKEI